MPLGRGGKGLDAFGRGAGRLKLADQGRLDRLVELSDLCSSAREIAVSLEDDFLVYLISMSIQAAQLSMASPVRPAQKR